MRNILSKENVKVLAKSIHLYMNSIKGDMMFKTTVDGDIECLIENMILDDAIGKADLLNIEKRTAEKLKRDEQIKKENLEWDRRKKVRVLKAAAMLS